MGHLEHLADAELLDRYLAGEDEAAFAAIVRRHGPMVYGVCRRVLRDSHEADDACQAVFLVLLRKAGSILPRSMLGNWLYGVARRTSLKARIMIAKRRSSLFQAAAEPAEPAVSHEERRELLGLLDEELGRLPDKYRSVIVLSDLEGKGRAEVAGQLDLPEGTVSSRLSRGRALLRGRLARRGFDVAPAALVAVLVEQAAEAALPAAVEALALKAVHAGAASVQASQLASAVVKSLLAAKLKSAAAASLVAAAIISGAGVGSYLAFAPGGGAAASTANAAPPRRDNDREPQKLPTKFAPPAPVVAPRPIKNDRALQFESAALAAIEPLGDDATLAQVLAAWEAGGSQLRSYDVYLTIEDKALLDGNAWQPLDAPIVSVMSSRQVYSAGKRRIEEARSAGPGKQETIVHIWDGRRAILHVAEYDLIRVEKYFNKISLEYDALFRLGHSTWSYVAMLRQRPETKLAGREEGLFVIYAPPAPGKSFEMSPLGMKFWLDPARGCLPVKSQVLFDESGTEFALSETTNQLREVARGVWAPVEALMRNFPSTLQANVPRRVAGEKKYKVDLKRSTFNVDISEATFQLDPT